MTVDDVRARVEAIRREADDDESAHIDEDSLHIDVLLVIAVGAAHGDHARQLAAEALMTREIKFARWCS